MNVHTSTLESDIQTSRLEWRIMLPVFLSVSLYAASAASVLPILPFFLREMGGTPLIFGIVIATEALTQFVAGPLVGQLSDRLGRKKINPPLQNVEQTWIAQLDHGSCEGLRHRKGVRGTIGLFPLSIEQSSLARDVTVSRRIAV